MGEGARRLELPHSTAIHKLNVEYDLKNVTSTGSTPGAHRASLISIIRKVTGSIVVVNFGDAKFRYEKEKRPFVV